MLESAGEHWNVTPGLEWWERPMVCTWKLGSNIEVILQTQSREGGRKVSKKDRGSGEEAATK